MKLLLDNNLSPQLVALLAAGGHQVDHVRDHDFRAASDDVVLGPPPTGRYRARWGGDMP